MSCRCGSICTTAEQVGEIVADAALVMGGVDGTRVEVVGNGAGVVKEAEGVTLDDDDLHGGPVYRLFAQLRRELEEDADLSIWE